MKRLASKKWLMLIVLPIWVLFCFALSELILSAILYGARAIGFSSESINASVFETLCSSFVYIVTIILTVFLPKLFKSRVVTLAELGLQRLPNWMEIFILPAGFIVYIILSAVLSALASKFIPGFDIDQAQEIGFDSLGQNFEYIMAFLAIVVIAPIAEETLFRGYLFGNLKKYVPKWLAILVVSIFFSFLHGAWNVGVDVFALSIVLCVLRETTGSIWASIMLHMAKNGIAFYLLFINPLILTTLGR